MIGPSYVEYLLKYLNSFSCLVFSLWAFMSFDLIVTCKQVLSMSRLGGAGAVAQLVADVPLTAVEVMNLTQDYLQKCNLFLSDSVFFSLLSST